MFELALLCPGDTVETLSDALQELDALSVSVEDADAEAASEQALYGEPGMAVVAPGWQHSRVLALFATAAAAGYALEVVREQDFFVGCQHLGSQEVPQQDWVRLTQAQFAPVAITPNFWIVPSWHELPAAAELVLRLDPGLAFGTGSHPTTRMCLRWLAGRAAADRQRALGRVLDYGCGSGILAIAAARLGATAVDAVDIDRAALDCTAHNALANAVTLQVGGPETAQGQYDLVLANILATPLKVLAPLLCTYLAPAATLVLSGILQRQADELTQAYAAYCRLRVADCEDGWILLTSAP